VRRLLAVVVVAALALALLDPGYGVRRQRHATPAASSSSGSLAVSNSRGGRAILTASKVAPGRLVAGRVTIANAGTLPGWFTLSQSNLEDAPGPNGGLLSGRLYLVVRELRGRYGARKIYAGKLADMGPRALGVFAPREARTYSFSARFPDGGPPLSPIGGDNRYAGSSTSTRYVWRAAEAASASGDRRPPRLRLRVPRVQRVLRRGYLVLYARCDEPCRVSVSSNVQVGRRRWPARRIRNRLVRQGRRARLKVRFTRRSRGVLRRALRAGRTSSVRLRVTARDRAGNATARRWTIRIRLRRR
jgi:spore coat-associated protein N